MFILPICFCIIAVKYRKILLPLIIIRSWLFQRPEPSHDLVRQMCYHHMTSYWCSHEVVYCTIWQDCSLGQISYQTNVFLCCLGDVF